MPPILQAAANIFNRRKVDPLEADLRAEQARLNERTKKHELLTTRNRIAQINAELDAMESRGKPIVREYRQEQESHVNSRPAIVKELAYATDPVTGYPFVPVIETWKLSETNRTRFEQDPLFGWPAGFGIGNVGGFDLWDMSTNVPVGAFPRELFPEKPSTLRTQIAQDAIRFMSRSWWETMPWYSGLIGHLCNYTVGSGLVVDVVSDTDDVLAQEVMDYLDEFFCFKWNNIKRRVRDSVLNLLRDGEDALHLFSLLGDDYPQIRSVDTSTIRGPHNEINGPWAYGVLTSWPRDYEDVQAYNIWYSDNTQEVISPDEMRLCKLDTTGANVKRGVPLAYKIRKQLPQLANLVDCMAVGEAARQAIPYIEQYDLADKSAVGAAFRSGQQQPISGCGPNGYNGYGTEYGADAIPPGQVRHISKGKLYMGPPDAPGFANSGSATYMTLCQAVANAANVPVWMVSGTMADSTSYATAFVAESPLVKVVRNLQDIVTEHYKAILESCVKMAVKQGRFPPDVLEVCRLHCELPSPVARNRKEEVETDLMLLDKGLMSPQHVDARNELDFDEETDLTAKAKATGWQNEIGVVKGERPDMEVGAAGQGETKPAEENPKTEAA